MAEEGIEELVRRIIRAAQEGVNTSRVNVASNMSTPNEELRRRFKNEIGSIRKKAEQALVGAAGEICQISPQAQGPEEMCLSLEHQNPSKTSEKVGYFVRVTVSLHIL